MPIAEPPRSHPFERGDVVTIVQPGSESVRGILIKSCKEFFEWAVLVDLARATAGEKNFLRVCVRKVPASSMIREPMGYFANMSLRELKRRAKQKDYLARQWLSYIASAVDTIDHTAPPLLPSTVKPAYLGKQSSDFSTASIWTNRPMECCDTVIADGLPGVDSWTNVACLAKVAAQSGSDETWVVVAFREALHDTVPCEIASAKLRLLHPYHSMQVMAQIGSAWHQEHLVRTCFALQLGASYAPPLDATTALQYLQRAARKGHVEAMYMLGLAGLVIDSMKASICRSDAMMWLRRAGLPPKQHAGAMGLITKLHLQGVVTQEESVDVMFPNKKDTCLKISMKAICDLTPQWIQFSRGDITIDQILFFSYCASQHAYEVMDEGLLDKACARILDPRVQDHMNNLVASFGRSHPAAMHHENLCHGAWVMKDMIKLLQGVREQDQWKTRMVAQDALEGSVAMICLRVPCAVDVVTSEKLAGELIDAWALGTLRAPADSNREGELIYLPVSVRSAVATRFGAWVKSDFFAFTWRLVPPAAHDFWSFAFIDLPKRLDLERAAKDFAQNAEVARRDNDVALRKRIEKQEQALIRLRRARGHSDVHELSAAIADVESLQALPASSTEMQQAGRLLLTLQAASNDDGLTHRIKRASPFPIVFAKEKPHPRRIQDTTVERAQGADSICDATSAGLSKHEKQKARRAAQKAQKREAADKQSVEERSHLLRVHPQVMDPPPCVIDESHHDSICLATVDGNLVRAEVLDAPSAENQTATTRHTCQRKPVSKRRQQFSLHIAEFLEIMQEDGDFAGAAACATDSNVDCVAPLSMENVQAHHKASRSYEDSRFTSRRSDTEASKTIGSIPTVMSWATDILGGIGVHCFLPNTIFQRSNGSYVRAAELRARGGDVLNGASGVNVLVRSCNRISSKRQHLVSVRVDGCNASFVVTADHRLVIQGPGAEPVPCIARDIVVAFRQGRRESIFNGQEFLAVIDADLFEKETGVFEVGFEGDAAVLAWLFPRRRNSTTNATCFAVLGKEEISVQDVGIVISNTFLDHPKPISFSLLDANLKASLFQPRSRSTGSHHDCRRSCWSVGTIGHDDSQPHLCNICAIHHRYLQDLDGPNPTLAMPCKKGAACQKCHARHLEMRSRLSHA